MDFLTKREASAYSPLALAFLGDSVYDTLVREYLLKKSNMPAGKLHAEKIKFVCAEFQSEMYSAIENILTENEHAVLKRGRNATGNTVPKHADTVTYRRATAVECLFGYLYLTGENNRIKELFNIITENIKGETDEQQ
ncbi:MAG: ribonuclease III [Ruminococcus sp.]|nr:ribonuclease III [Ruminococcus sp.]MBR6386420.1 ribonuclease III [Ruminococcus sp.]